jgi:hypothetical protein
VENRNIQTPSRGQSAPTLTSSNLTALNGNNLINDDDPEGVMTSLAAPVVAKEKEKEKEKKKVKKPKKSAVVEKIMNNRFKISK